MSLVTIPKFITCLPQYQQLCAALLAGFLLCTAGNAVMHTDEQKVIQVPEETQTYDIFSYKAYNEVKPMMDKALENPTKENLRNTNNHLKIGIQNWTNQNEDQNKDIFQEYITACEKVIDDMQAGKQADTTEMNLLYTQLENN